MIGDKGDTRISAFCIDFNWDMLGRFASPGLYATARAEEHLKWYQELGVNTIQAFCVSTNGYAWYESEVAPRTPGMRGGFLEQLVELGHGAGMRVMGYFSPGANGFWQRKYPDYSHQGVWDHWHMPFTKKYLDYVCSMIEEVVRAVPIDGFMVDWLWNVDPIWMRCEVEMYEELMGGPFPGATAVSTEQREEFNVRATQRAWERIHATTKEARKDCIIWLSCNNPLDPQLQRTSVPSEVDWLMNEHPDPARLKAAGQVKGPETRLIQCIVGWEGNPVDHDAAALLDILRLADVGLYGFARPDPKTTLPAEDRGSNSKNIAAMRRFNYRHTRG